MPGGSRPPRPRRSGRSPTRVVSETQDVEISPSRPGRNSDQAFNGVGLPLLQFNHMRLAEDGGYWWWHTTEDTFDKIDPDVLKTDTDIYAHALAEMLAGAVYPVSLSAQVEALVAAISARDEEGGRSTATGTAPRRPRSRAFAQGRGGSGRARHRGHGRTSRSGGLSPAPAPRHVRAIVPLNDYHPDARREVGLGPLPGLAPARILAEEEAGSDRRGFALPVLLRERNRLIEAADEALLVGGWLTEEPDR